MTELIYDLQETETPRGGRLTARSQAGDIAELTFTRIAQDLIRADHTGVPNALGGQGVGTSLVERLVDYARGQGAKIDPRCSFVEAKMKTNPEWAPLIAA